MLDISNISHKKNWLIKLCLGFYSASLLAAPPTVVEPSGNDDRVPAGYDFATQELGDPWDMDRMEDIFTPNSIELVNESVSGGIYSFDTIERDLAGLTKGQFWLIHPGVLNSQLLVSEDRNPVTGNKLFTREWFPIDTQVYRYFTARVRMRSTTAQPLEKNQPFIVYYFEDSTSIGKALFGNSTAFGVPPDEWTIVQIDLATEVDPNGPESWSELPKVTGIRIDPTNLPDVHVEVDWIRLTSAPQAEEEFNVAWTGNGSGGYSVAARQEGVAGAAAFELASGVSGNNVDITLSQLPPGDYRIEVSGSGETGISPGVLAVNHVPLISFTSPNIKGDQNQAYGKIVNANPWSQIDAGDAAEVLGFESHSFSNPSGSLTGRPETDRSRVLMNTPLSVDTALYRMMCFEEEIKGPRDIGAGSVTKILWGNIRSKLTTPRPVIAQEGLNEYCLGDMAEIEIDPLGPDGAEDAWIGPARYIRFDPHEFPRTAECNNNPSPEACRDVRFDSLILAPFHRANPDFTFQWKDSDIDDNASLEIWLDDDKTPGNTPQSIEHLVGVVNENHAGDSLNWTPPGNIADNKWYVYGLIDDGLNTTIRYAGGPLQIGAPPTASITITSPRGGNDFVFAGAEYGLHERKNQWDMANGEFNLSRKANISGLELSGGLLSGTATSTNPQFTLMTSKDGDPLIDPASYRYLTIKLRASGAAGPHFVQFYFNEQPDNTSSLNNFTNGVPINENEWSIVTFDLHTDISPNSPKSWLELAGIRSLRVDPTTRSGTQFEIDWITLSAPPTPATEYQVRWSATNTGFSTFDLNLVDSMGYRIQMATGLSTATRFYTVNLGKLVLDQYFVEVTASPGPTAISQGPISLIAELPPNILIFRSGFE